MDIMGKEIENYSGDIKTIQRTKETPKIGQTPTG